MAKIGTAVLELTTDNTKFASGLDQAERRATGLGTKLTGVGKTLTAGLSLPLAALGGIALKFSTDFNASMANVATLIPGNAARVAELKNSVQELAVAHGKDTQDLAAGLYQTISAFGDDAAETVKILEINSKAASAGLATTEEAIALTSVVTKNYGDASAEAVGKTSDLALLTVRLGQTTFPELAASMGRVTPTAAALGVSQEELFGVMATGTGVVGTASEVSTKLAGVFAALQNPTDAMNALFKEQGVASGEALLAQEGLGGAMALILKEANDAGVPLAKYVGSLEGQNIVTALGGELADQLADKTKALGEAAGATDIAFKEQTEGVNKAGFMWDQFKAKLQVIVQRLGEELLPVVIETGEALEPLLELVLDGVKWFGTLSPAVKRVAIVVAGLAAALGPLLVVVGSVISAGSALGITMAGLGTAFAILTGPIGLTVAAIVGLGVVWATWGDDITRIVSETIGSVRTWFVETFGGIVDTVQDKVEAVTGFFRGMYQSVVGGSIVPDMLNGIRREFRRLKPEMVDPTKTATKEAEAAFESFKTAVEGHVAYLRGEASDGVKAFVAAVRLVGDVAVEIRPGIEGLFTPLDHLRGEFAGVEEVAPRAGVVVGEFGNMAGTALGVEVDKGTFSLEEFLETTGRVEEEVPPATTTIWTAFGDMAKNIVGTLSTLGVTIGGKFGEFTKMAQNLALSFKETFTGIQNVTSQFSNGFKATAGALITNIGSITGAVSLGISAVKGLIGFFTGPSSVEMFNNAARLGELSEEAMDKFHRMLDAFNQLQAAHEAAGEPGSVGSSPDKNERESPERERRSLSIPILDNPLGSLVTGPTLAGLAINGHPEFVLPASDFGGMLRVQEESRGLLETLNRNLLTVLPSLMESAGRHGAQTAGRRR